MSDRCKLCAAILPFSGRFAKDSLRASEKLLARKYNVQGIVDLRFDILISNLKMQI